jgi:hypothetical protein
MITLNTIKNYFGDKMAKPNHNVNIEALLTSKEKQIFFDIGLPEVNIAGGVPMLIFRNLSLHEDKYIPFYKSSLSPDDMWSALNTETHEVSLFSFGKIYDEGINLEDFLIYIYIFHEFLEEVLEPQIFGNDYGKIGDELVRRFRDYGTSYEGTYWEGIISEYEVRR